jgi:hypothetical protein
MRNELKPMATSEGPAQETETETQNELKDDWDGEVIDTGRETLREWMENRK